MDKKQMRMELPIGAVVTLKSKENKKLSAWVGIVVKPYSAEKPWLCYINFPMRADMKGEMSHCSKQTALELVSNINGYEIIDNPNEKRHLYTPELWKEYPSFQTKHKQYLTYREYLQILDRI